MTRDKINYLRGYFKLTNDISDYDIATRCNDTMESKRYDIRGEMARIMDELSKVVPNFVRKLFGI